MTEELKNRIADANAEGRSSIEVRELSTETYNELKELGYFIYNGSLERDSINTIISWAHKPIEKWGVQN